MFFDVFVGVSVDPFCGGKLDGKRWLSWEVLICGYVYTVYMLCMPRVVICAQRVGVFRRSDDGEMRKYTKHNLFSSCHWLIIVTHLYTFPDSSALAGWVDAEEIGKSRKVGGLVVVLVAAGSGVMYIHSHSGCCYWWDVSSPCHVLSHTSQHFIVFRGIGDSCRSWYIR